MRRQAKRLSQRQKQGPASATEAANSQLYGMSVTRGARYLLRNGLDYLSYQQYDRALKFLREAEARITDQKSRKVQMELNDAEVTALKQGIETAQRGLRRASNAEIPYALSDKSRPTNGFTPARPSNKLTARGKQPNVTTRHAKAPAVAPQNSLIPDGDDDGGQPVHLASGERTVSDQPTELNPSPRPAGNTNSLSLGSVDTKGPMSMPETPQIPVVSRLPDLTVVDGSESLAAAEMQETTRTRPAVDVSSSNAQRTSNAAPETRISEQNSPLVSTPSVMLTMAPAERQTIDSPQPVSSKPVDSPPAQSNRPTPLDPASSLPPLASPDASPAATDRVAESKTPAVEQGTVSTSARTERNPATPGHAVATTAEPGAVGPQTLENSPTTVPNLRGAHQATSP